MKSITLSANSSWYLYNFRSSSILQAMDAGFKVTCISPKDDYSKNLIEIGCEHYPIDFSSKSKNPFQDFLLILKFFIAYLKIKPYATFHFTVKNNIYGTLAARMLGIPSINNISGLGTAFLRRSFLSRLVLTLYKISQPFAYKIFCQNIEDLDFLKNNKVASSQKLILIPGSGVDTSKFHPTLRKNYRFASNRVFTFIFAGRILYDKGLSELMGAMKEINESSIKCRLILCGFVDSNNLSAVSNEDLNYWSSLPGVDWIGSSDAVEGVMAQADCIILPSYREGMPKTLLEAGSMEIPAIATNVPGCRSIIKDGLNGFLCEPFSSKSIQLAMEKIMKMKNKDLKEMGKRARSEVLLNFDESIVIDAFFSVLDELK